MSARLIPNPAGPLVKPPAARTLPSQRRTSGNSNRVVDISPLLTNVRLGGPAGGNPSSNTVPVSCAVAGSVIDWFGPELTIGAWFAVTTVTVTSELLLSTESLALKRRT